MAQPPSGDNHGHSSDDDGLLELTLGLSSNTANEQPLSTTTTPSDPPPTNSRCRQRPHEAQTRSVRRKLDNSVDSEKITPPYPWATDRPCRLHSMKDLESNGHTSITGTVTCKKCERSYEMAFDLGAKFWEIGCYFFKMKDEMRHRALEFWKNPTLPECRYCGERNAAKPEVAGKDKTNWLFLFLGEMIGCCKLEELKYFLSKNNVHRTAAKDRIVYLVYLCICKQLDPTAPFDL